MRARPERKRRFELEAVEERIAASSLAPGGMHSPAQVAPRRVTDPDELQWSIVLSTAPGTPQDVWIAATGSNEAGWRGGGSICLGPLAQGFEPGYHATIQTDVVEAGIIGVDGTPVQPGTYTAPGIELPDLTFEVVSGETFYVIVKGYVVESNIPFIPAGTETTTMFTFTYEAGRSEQQVVAWSLNQEGKFVPFLNEGVMMTNVRQHP